MVVAEYIVIPACTTRACFIWLGVFKFSSIKLSGKNFGSKRTLPENIREHFEVLSILSRGIFRVLSLSRACNSMLPSIRHVVHDVLHRNRCTITNWLGLPVQNNIVPIAARQMILPTPCKRELPLLGDFYFHPVLNRNLPYMAYPLGQAFVGSISVQIPIYYVLDSWFWVSN